MLSKFQFCLVAVLIVKLLFLPCAFSSSRDSSSISNVIPSNTADQSIRTKSGGSNRAQKGYDPEREIQEATEALTRNKNNAIAYERRGAAYNRLEKWDRALTDLDESIKLNSNSATARFHRGLAHYKRKSYQLALNDLTKAIQLNPNMAPAFACRANVYTSMEKYQLAIRDAKEALRLDPNDPNNQLAFSRAAYYVGQHGASIQACSKAIQMNPKNPIAWDNRGIAYLDARQFAKAVSDITTAIKLKGNEAKYFCHRGIVYCEMGDYDRAIRDLSQAISLKNDYSLALFDRGVSYFRMGKYDLAHNDITMAIHYDPHYALAWEELPLDPTRMPKKKDSMDKAEDWYYRAADKILLKRNENAIDDLKKYLQLAGWQAEFSQNAVLLLYIGYKRINQDTQAQTILDEAANQCDKAQWQYTVIRFFRKEVSEEDLLKQVLTLAQETEARSCISLEHLMCHRTQKAMAHLNWLQSNGDGAVMTYSLALREIEKMHPTKTLNTERFYEHARR